MPRNFDHIVDASDDPKISIRIAFGRVAGCIFAGILAPILTHITVRVTVNGPQHRWPCILQYEVSFRVIGNGFAAFVHDFGLLSKEGTRTRAGFQRHNRSRRDHERAGLCLPPGVNDRQLIFANHAVIPLPGFRVDRLTDRAEQAQGRKIVLFGPGVTETHESTNGRRSRVEDRNPIALDALPPTIWLRIRRSTFEEEGCDSVEHGTIYQIRVPCDPAGVGGAPPTIIITYIEAIFEGCIGTDHVA